MHRLIVLLLLCWSAWAVTSYDTSNRKRSIIVTWWFNGGNTGQAPQDMVDGNASGTGVWHVGSGFALDGSYIQFDAGEPLIIDEARWYQSDNRDMGLWHWQGSNDASAWVDVGGAFLLGGATVSTHAELNGNTTPYYYYRLVPSPGQTSKGSPIVYEIQFRSESLRKNGASYSNPGGSGNRTGGAVAISGNLWSGTNSLAVDGDTLGNGPYFSGTAIDGRYEIFDFGVPKLVDQIGVFLSSNGAAGNFQMYGSNNGSTWRKVGITKPLLLTGSGVQVTSNYFHFEGLYGNVFGFRYYKLANVGGVASTVPIFKEVEFRITDGVPPAENWLGCSMQRADSVY